jgi:sugar phosphate isomerase/epimerase
LPDKASTHRLGFSTLGTPRWRLADVLARAAEWRCDCIELRVLDGEVISPSLSRATVSDTARRIADSGITLETLGTSVRLIDAERARSDLPALIAMAAQMRAARLRVFSGPAPGDGAAGADEMRRMADVLHETLPIARQAGVGIALETHHALSGSEPVAELLALVPDDTFGVIWDYVYTWIAGDAPETAWRRLGGRTVEIQAKDVTRTGGHKFTPRLLGEGDVPFAASLAAALSGGFAGPIVVEWEKHWHPEIDEPEVAIPQHLALIREILAMSAGGPASA